ncbi:MAG: phage tail tip lysozyme [Actinomycetota bacterium]|nr:phage tail tip lysozyme [Actinomycetota bacterium]
MHKLVSLAAGAVVAATLVATATSASAAATTVAAAGMSHSISAVTPSVISSNEETAFNYFVGKGLTNKQSAGIIGNLDQESGMDPTIKQYGGGPGRGIAQWSVGGRWDTDPINEVDYTNNTLGVSRYNLDGQLKFIWKELTSESGFGLSSLKATTTIDGATSVFASKYEVCGNCNLSARESFANTAYNKYA